MLQANEVLKRLGGQWMLQSEAQRLRVTSLPPVAWRHPVAALLDREQRDRVLRSPGSRETTYFLTLTWTPPAAGLSRGLGWLMQGPGRPTPATQEQVSVREFVEQADYLIELLRGVLAVGSPLTTGKTLTYLHSTVSDRWYEVGLLASLMDIDVQLCDSPLVGGWYPQLGRRHVRTCTIIGYPAESMVGVMRTLDAADLDYRWCTRWIGMEKAAQQQMLRKQQWAWVGQERSFVQRAGESVSHEKSRVIDSDATNKALDVDAARQEIGMDIVAYGDFTGTVTVWDEEPEVAEHKRRVVMQALQARGFTVREETEHATAAWLSSHPGNRLDNVRRTPQHSLTLAHLCPGLTAAWPGQQEDAYLQGGPWFYAHTDETTLFRVVNHLRDLGQFLVLGQTRSGKSTYCNFLRAMWMQYLNAQAKVFDLDGHARLLTYLLGGYWYDLGSPGLQLQPLRHIDDPLRQDLLLQWLLDILDANHVTVNAYSQMYVRGSLQQLALRPAAQRTWEEFLRILAEKPAGYLHEVHNHRVRVDAQGIGHEDVHLRALEQLKAEVRWTFQRYADIFGAAEDTLPAHPVQTFELRSLLTQTQLLGPVMRYIMLEVSQQMSTNAPMFLLLDDAAVAWLMPKVEQQQGSVVIAGRQSMEQQCLDWLQTTAKKAVSLGVSTHSLEKVFESPIGRILIEGCQLRFYMANPSAMDPIIRRIYEEAGLSSTAIRQIATLRPQRDVYMTRTEVGQRSFALPHSKMTLDCLARNSADDHEVMNRLLAQEGREGFAAAWLRSQGYEEEAKDVEAWGSLSPAGVGADESSDR